MRRFLLAVLLCVSIWPLVPAYAQTRGIGITPAIDELVLQEGQASAELEITVVNDTDEEAVLRLFTIDFGALDASGGIAFLGQTGQEVAPRGLSRWMRLDKETLQLATGQSEKIKVTVENSDALPPGGHYGAVIVSAVADEQPGGDAVALQPAASTLVLLKKRGGETYGLELEDVKANKSLINLPKNVTFSFRNTGNVHVVPRGKIELVSPTGSVVKRGVINEQSSFVLPDSARNYEVQLSGGSAWLPGRYKVVINWRFDGQETFNQTVEYFWYIGKATIFLFVVLCTIFVLIMYVKYRKRPVSRY